MSDRIIGFFKNAMKDIKENAKSQHEVDKANLAAFKAESKAQWEEAKAQGRPDTVKRIIQIQHTEELADAQKRITAANSRIESTKR